MTQPNQHNVEIENVPPTEVSSQDNVRLDSVSQPSPTNRNDVGFWDWLRSAFQEIRSLVVHARMSLFHHNTHQASERLQQPQSSIAHVDPMSNVALGEPEQPEATQGHQEINPFIHPPYNDDFPYNVNSDSQSNDDDGEIFDRETVDLLIRYAPFCVILLTKFLYDARRGVMTFSLLLGSFFYGNHIVTREHAALRYRKLFKLFTGIFWTLMPVISVNYGFGDGKFLRNVIMLPVVYSDHFDVWELLWLVLHADQIVKNITVTVKILVTMMPACVLQFQKRGKIYAFIESFSQLYRCLVPIQPWVFFLMQSYEGSEKYLGIFLIALYGVAKLVELLMRTWVFKNATWTMLQSVNLSTKPTSEQILAAGDACSICHGDFKTPVRLSCSHIFCELCINEWLLKSHTCPLCRAALEDEQAWRDGQTTFHFQFY